MKSNKRVAALIIFKLLAITVWAASDQASKGTDSSIHLIRCSIDKVNQCLAQESASGYVAIHVAATIMDRPRTAASGGYGLMSSEDPVLVTQKSNAPKRQTIAIIDDLAKRETQINQAGAAGMRMLPYQLAVLRSWSAGVPQGGFGVVRSSAGGVSVDGYAILFEEAQPPARFEYRVIDAANEVAPEKLKKLAADGYRAVAIVAPSTLVLERSSAAVPKVGEYRILRIDAQHLGPELSRATGEGFRVLSTAASTTGSHVLVLLERAGEAKAEADYQVPSSYGAAELEKRLNEAARGGYFPLTGGMLPIITTEPGRFGIPTPPQRIELVLSKNLAPKYSTFKVLNAFSKDLQPALDAALRDGYQFVEFVGVMNQSFVILGQSAQPSAPKN